MSKGRPETVVPLDKCVTHLIELLPEIERAMKSETVGFGMNRMINCVRADQDRLLRQGHALYPLDDAEARKWANRQYQRQPEQVRRRKAEYRAKKHKRELRPDPNQIIPIRGREMTRRELNERIFADFENGMDLPELSQKYALTETQIYSKLDYLTKPRVE